MHPQVAERRAERVCSVGGVAMPNSPVENIATDNSAAGPEPGLARAMAVFHIGVRKRQVCDAALRKHVRPGSQKPAQLPYPAAGV